jgi:molecular chaperone GrpE (heat shock protein)
VNSQIARLSSKGLKEIEEEQSMWQEELTKLRKIQPSATIVQELKDDGIPTLEKQVKDETTKLERAQEEVEEVS